ncbi:MAG: hypothetical protein M3Z66_00110 [Chloroflexota bacterium]|nr:hypothetical protein [Chloroflexota bacterium]
MPEMFEDELMIGVLHAAYEPFDAATRQRVRDQILSGAQVPEPARPAHRAEIWRGRQALRLGTALVLGAALVGTVVYAATSVIRVHLPEQPLTRKVVPYFLPTAMRHYTFENPATAGGRPVAFLGHPPASFSRSIAVSLSSPFNWNGNPAIDAVVRSTVRYRGTGHTVLVTMFEPSPKDVGTKVFELATKTMHLANGQRAWSSSSPGRALDRDIQPPAQTVNGVEFTHGRFIVGVFSDLPVPAVSALAAQVVVRVPVPKRGNHR